MDLDILIFIIRIILILVSFVWFYAAYYHMTNINGKKNPFIISAAIIIGIMVFIGTIISSDEEILFNFLNL